jgi:pyruvate, water dikinase
MFIKTFDQITKKDAASAGGKGASLGEMTKAKMPIPPGFVLLASAFERFLDETDLTQELEAALNAVNYQDVNSVDRASTTIRTLIKQAKMPQDLATDLLTAFKKLGSPFVAVRSSATAEDSSDASWAGELETYLNTTEKTLLENVKLCWSSLFTPRAIFYRHEKDLVKTKVSVAVVVQAMIDSEISGITFTVHPVTQDKEQMIIEAGYGLGEAIVSGSITPDAYVIDKRDFSIIDINISLQEREIVKCLRQGVKWKKIPAKMQEKQKLSGQEIIELAKICANIEKHYKFPCDIEWAYFKSKFYITQSRPITTL